MFHKHSSGYLPVIVVNCRRLFESYFIHEYIAGLRIAIFYSYRKGRKQIRLQERCRDRLLICMKDITLYLRRNSHQLNDISSKMRRMQKIRDKFTNNIKN